MILFLEVLKWIGIVILAVLAIIIVLLLFVLFVPIRYKVLSEGQGTDIKANVKANWFGPVLSVRYNFDLQNKSDNPLVIRIFGIKIGRNKKQS